MSPQALCIQGPENRTSRCSVSSPISRARLPRKGDDWSGWQTVETGSRSFTPWPPIWLEKATATALQQKSDYPCVAQKSKAIQDVSLVCLEWNRGTTTERISCTPHTLVGCRSLGRHRHGVDCRRHRLPFASAIRVCLSHQGATQERGSVLATLPHGFCNTGPLVVVCGNANTVCNPLI